MEIIQSISDFIPLSFTIIIVVLITAIIVRAILNIEPISKVTIPLAVVCAPGTVLHELSHLLFATLAGSNIYDVSLFHYEKYQTIKGEKTSVGGHVSGEFPDSLTARFFIGMGPTIINGFVVSLIIYFISHIPEGLSYYLIFALILGARPSSADMRLVLSCFKENGGRSLYELSAVAISAIIGIFVATWNKFSLYEINWLYFTIVFTVSLICMLSTYKLATSFSS